MHCDILILTFSYFLFFSNFFNSETTLKNRSGDTPGHFAASMGHEDVFHLLMDYNRHVTHVRNDRGATPMEAARGTGQVRLVKTIQQRLQARSNEMNPPVHIPASALGGGSESAGNGGNGGNGIRDNGMIGGADGAGSGGSSAASGSGEGTVLIRTNSVVSVTEEIDPFPDQWGAVAPPPMHSPPPPDNDRYDNLDDDFEEQISTDSGTSGASTTRSGNVSSDLSDDEEVEVEEELVAAAGVEKAGVEKAGAEQEELGNTLSNANALIVAEDTEYPSDVVMTTNQLWTEMYDEHHQLPYYMHMDGHSQWEMPTGFVSQWGAAAAGAAASSVTEEEEVNASHRSAQEDTDHWSARYYGEEENGEWEEQVEEEVVDVFTDVPPPPVNGPGGGVETGIQRSMSYTM